MLDLSAQLNPSQYAAVTTIDGPVLVIAGAGSGKTRVIEYRVLHLVQNGIIPNKILLLTFTRKAAREMLTRASRHDKRCSNVEGGTFHSFGYKILKRFANVIGLQKSFTVLDEGDAEEAIQLCCNSLKVFDKLKRYPKKETIKKIISMSINKNIPIREVLINEYPHFLEYSTDIEKIWKIYMEYKIERNYLDYDDLLVFLRLLLENESIKNHLSDKYQYIMVDEFQDTNKLQGDIVFLLGEKHRNVMVVGDDAQSIYAFRGASHKNIMEFPKKFPECKIVKLEENYRSTQAILDLANSVLENMKDKYSKCLISANKKIGIKPSFFTFNSSQEEAEWVANNVKKFYDEGIPFNHQAVLYRSANISIPIQAELSKRNIPFQVLGGRKFYETAHFKDLISHFKIVVNQKDELSWNKVLMLIEGIGPKISETILNEILLCNNPDDIFSKVFSKHLDGKKYSAEFAKFVSVLYTLFFENISIREKFEKVLNYYIPILKTKFDDWHLRLNDLKTLTEISDSYNSLDELLAYFALEPFEIGVSEIKPSQPLDVKPITLSTIHSAKGLEWDVVFIISLIDGILPISYAIKSTDELEEEHRLFYVGITRAKNFLFLSMHNEGIGDENKQFNRVSRFIDVPNVLSKLERNRADSIPKVKPVSKEDEIITPIYDKKSWLNKIIDFFLSN